MSLFSARTPWLFLVVGPALLAGCPLPPIQDTDDPIDTDDPEDTDDTDPGPSVLTGVFVDNFEGEHEITEDSWTNGEDVYHLTDWSAEESWVVAENDSGNTYNPGKWSRFDLVAANQGWWYCQTRYDAATEDEARTSPAADDADPATSGCGGFSWTRMYVPLPLRGDWVDNFGGTHEIREWSWVSGDLSFRVTDYDLEKKWVLAQNDEGNAWNPGKWSRFDWTDQGGAFWFCQVAFDAESESAARAVAAADPTDPANGGCGGFSWSALSKP